MAQVVRRGGEPEGPVDGALMIVVGGAEPDRDALRPFLLNRLRMNPTGWESLGVLDRGREVSAKEALDRAPAGIVLLCEGWALSPRQMDHALGEVVVEILLRIGLLGVERADACMGHFGRAFFMRVTGVSVSDWSGSSVVRINRCRARRSRCNAE